MRLLFTLPVVLLAVALPSLAQAQSSSCSPYDSDAYEQAQAMTVKASSPKQPVHFQSEAKACPAKGTCRWKQRSYLIQADTVLAGPEQNGFRCAHYVTAKGKPLAGFLPSANLEPARAPRTLDLAFLTGRWVAGENDITFTAGANGQVHAEGLATYTTDMGANTGDFSGDAKPGGEQLRFGNPEAEDECVVTVQRRGPYLLVSDNLRCGGVNVSFRGLYARVKTK
jgi:hypothetical protein